MISSQAHAYALCRQPCVDCGRPRRVKETRTKCVQTIFGAFRFRAETAGGSETPPVVAYGFRTHRTWRAPFDTHRALTRCLRIVGTLVKTRIVGLQTALRLSHADQITIRMPCCMAKERRGDQQPSKQRGVADNGYDAD